MSVQACEGRERKMKSVQWRLGAVVWLAVLALVMGWSWIGAHDPGVWLMEVLPVFIVVPLLGFTLQRFALTPLLYWLIAVHAIILMVGGHYTYAKVPLGFWLQEGLDLSRNHYDRIGHFAQGFIPAIAARAILLRRSPLTVGRWLLDRKSTRLNSSHVKISYAVLCLKK